MKISFDYPPNYKEMAARFPVQPTTVFTYGDTLYMPNMTDGPDGALLAHESVHSERQLAMGVEDWFQAYYLDSMFRLAEETLAYRAQYQVAVEKYSRPERRQLLQRIAKDLAGPLYGKMLSRDEAKDVITAPELITAP